ncbi:HD-GYP domain-containing protein [Methylomonas fluvii]|uniref:DUF3391 domain-containing protein n=1 Tax=Methylomonas fluvii TaxID=1854564 RepID=A0ABR9DBG3_9GAMM|nr:HD-GYP domain-containing protein [Methylomonas fluvii]MBD9360454.1 DUF3391 domain-containing protein [Methylomonas fluvii]
MVKKININQLRKGMFVCGTDRKWLDTPFFRTKFLISSDKQINTLKEYCQTVSIDTAKGLDVAEPDHTETITDAGKVSTTQMSSDLNENATFKPIYQQSLLLFGELLNDARGDRVLDGGKIDKIAADLLAAVSADTQAILGLIQCNRENKDRLALKSVNVCILAAVLGAYLKLPENNLRLLVRGALLHDIGMLAVPDAVLLKTVALTPEERLVVQQHPAYGLALLSKVPEMPADVLEIVVSHHEQLDGGGYPNGLLAERIGELTRIVRIVSVYEALTGERFYHKSLTPLEALTSLYGSGPSLFDTQLLARFIEALGIYPVNSIVELQTDELAAVARENSQSPRRPLVKVITNPQKQLLFQERLLDLADEQQNQINIVRVLASDEPIIELLKMFVELEKT